MRRHDSQESYEREPRIKSVECGICETTFTDGTIPEIAQQVAHHWNMDHPDEFYDMQPFKTEKFGGENIHDNVYSYRVIEYYITAYDVLDTSGHTIGPFNYNYVKEPTAFDRCEDCGRSIEAVDGYQELETSGWRDTYLCDACNRQRDVSEHKENNQSLTEFA